MNVAAASAASRSDLLWWMPRHPSAAVHHHDFTGKEGCVLRGEEGDDGLTLTYAPKLDPGLVRELASLALPLRLDQLVWENPGQTEILARRCLAGTSHRRLS